MAEDTAGAFETSQPVYQEAVSKLRAFIENSDLGPGDFLPAERKLSETFLVSRHTLREAIKALQEKGILAVKRGSGNYIASTSVSGLKQQLLDCIQTERDQLADIFQFPGQGLIRDDRHIGRFHAFIGQIDTGRRFRGPGNPHQNDIGVLQTI